MPRKPFALLAALALLPLAGCGDGQDTTTDGVQAQIELNDAAPGSMDPNELPADVTPEDETMGDGRLADPAPEPDTNEYDSLPLTEGDGGERD